MLNYFDSISLYSWNMTDEQVSKFETKLEKLEWIHMLILQLIFTVILTISFFILLKNVMPDTTLLSEFWILLISNLIIGLLFLFGSYYFLKIFFKTKLSLIQFYTATIYLYLPLLVMYTITSLIAMGLSFISIIYTYFSFILYIFLIYYAFKELNTYLYLFKTEFNTTVWKLFVVLILWGIIINFISSSFNNILLSLF